MTMQDFLIVGAGTLVLFALFVGISFAREYGALNLWAVLRRYVAVQISEADDARSAAQGAASDAAIVERPQTHQVNDGFDDETASPQSLVLRQLPRTELIVMLAVQRKDDGSYLWSSNEIKKFVPGTDGSIGEIIATVRGKKPVEPPPANVRRPMSGW